MTGPHDKNWYTILLILESIFVLQRLSISNILVPHVTITRAHQPWTLYHAHVSCNDETFFPSIPTEADFQLARMLWHRKPLLSRKEFKHSHELNTVRFHSFENGRYGRWDREEFGARKGNARSEFSETRVQPNPNKEPVWKVTLHHRVRGVALQCLVTDTGKVKLSVVQGRTEGSVVQSGGKYSYHQCNNDKTIIRLPKLPWGCKQCHPYSYYRSSFLKYSWFCNLERELVFPWCKPRPRVAENSWIRDVCSYC